MRNNDFQFVWSNRKKEVNLMDKTVEMEIIAVVGVLGVVALIYNQWNIVTVIASGLIGFLSHGIITPSIESEEPEKNEGA
jgi:predicted membrane protein